MSPHQPNREPTADHLRPMIPVSQMQRLAIARGGKNIPAIVTTMKAAMRTQARDADPSDCIAILKRNKPEWFHDEPSRTPVATPEQEDDRGSEGVWQAAGATALPSSEANERDK